MEMEAPFDGLLARLKIGEGEGAHLSENKGVKSE